MRGEEAEAALVAAGYRDLNLRMVRFFGLFANVLRDRPLQSFEDCNEYVGTANGVASGAVRQALAALIERGYLRISKERGLELTARGIAAARVAGVGRY